jgi:hypothetical protein
MVGEASTPVVGARVVASGRAVPERSVGGFGFEGSPVEVLSVLFSVLVEVLGRRLLEEEGEVGVILLSIFLGENVGFDGWWIVWLIVRSIDRLKDRWRWCG